MKGFVETSVFDKKLLTAPIHKNSKCDTVLIFQFSEKSWAYHKAPVSDHWYFIFILKYLKVVDTHCLMPLYIRC